MKYFAFVILCCLCFYGCFGDRGSGCVGEYIFEIPLMVTPESNTLKVGDTMSVTMHTDNTMLVDLVDTGRLANYPNFDPFISFFLVSLDSLPIRDGLVVHDVIVHEGNETLLVDGKDLSDFLIFLKIDAGETESKLGFDIVLREKGTFALYAYNELSYIDRRDFIDFPDRCGGRCCSGTSAWMPFNGGDNHSDLLTEHTKEVENNYWGEFTGTRDASNPYYFKVE